MPPKRSARLKAPTVSKQPSTSNNLTFDRKLIIAKDGVIKDDKKAMLLSHPRTRAPTLYYGVGSGNTLCELVKVGDGKRSLLIGESAVEDGDVVFLVPINPLFLVLPSLEKKKKHAVTLEDLLVDPLFPQLNDLKNSKNLLIALRKLDHTKLAEWLRKKYEMAKKIRDSEEEALNYMQEVLLEEHYNLLRITLGLKDKEPEKVEEEANNLKRSTKKTTKQGAKKRKT
ncbi:hypothetical protein L596_029326 [Steinernema carpocapsae]|uniref:Rnh202 triple barrel domain-containing protein n=1 Tax=Steinernema carpocapsae TaxID=34508 RepID=A0A4U5LUB0_STECR|nr:hypothetical protein L596_029326 [Steinernema carpocapsae]